MALSDCISAAQAAGFNGAGLVTILSISGAESGWNKDAKNTNQDGSVDRGPLQINDKWHPEVPDQCAYDYTCAFQAGWKISKNGTDFSPWSTFNQGSSNGFIQQVQSALSGAVSTVGGVVSNPLNLPDVGKAIGDFGVRVQGAGTIALGGIMIIAGLFLAIVFSRTGKKVIGTAAKLAIAIPK